MNPMTQLIYPCRVIRQIHMKSSEHKVHLDFVMPIEPIVGMTIFALTSISPHGDDDSMDEILSVNYDYASKKIVVSIDSVTYDHDDIELVKKIYKRWNWR